MFSWHDFLLLAQKLAREGDEASKRTAVSRAYYAAFNLARKLLEERGVPIPDEGRAHSVVWCTLRESGKGLRWIGMEGDRLRKLRCQADYVDHLKDIDKTLAVATSSAHSIVALIGEELRKGKLSVL